VQFDRDQPWLAGPSLETSGDVRIRSDVHPTGEPATRHAPDGAGRRHDSSADVAE
jgi:hypothetical protein